MISFVRGKIFEARAASVVVDVNGVGYEVNTSLTTIGSLQGASGDVTLYTETYVREDVIALYGFATKDELTMFDQLLTVSGVGPKVALQIISGISPTDFAMSVLNDDHKSFTRISGVGPKLAQRLVLELKDKIKKDMKTQNIKIPARVQGTVSAAADPRDECVFALCTLGFNPQVARQAVESVYTDGMSVEAAVRSALKTLAKS